MLFVYLLSWVDIHCGIYKNFYNVSNISYLNSPPPQLSLFLPSPYSWNSFSKYHFWIFTHVSTLLCTVFTLLLPFLSSPSLPPPHWRFCSGLLWFCRRNKKQESFKGSYTGCFLVIFPCIYVLYSQLVYFL
jgi:hypothetical protein